MTEWKEYKLGEIATFISEKVSVKDISVENYISTENMVSDKGGITVATNKPLDGTITKYYPNNILVSNIRPYFKKIWFSNRDGGCSNDVLCFEANTKYINPKYLYFLLSQDLFFDYVMLGSKGCKMPRGDKSHIMNWDISLPPLPEQIRIASILSSLDDKIDLLHRENKTLEAMAETLFRQWFIEEAKEDWEEKSLGKCLKLVGGGTPKTSEERFWNGKVCWLSGGDITNNHKSFVSCSEKSISEDGLNNSSAKLLPENAMVVSARGTVGKYCLLSKPMAFSQSNYGILPIYTDCYFFTYLLVAYHIEELQSAAYGSVFDTITTKTFEGVNVLLPQEPDYIVEFEKMIEPCFSKMKQNNNQIQTLTQQRDGLLPKLMSGEVKI
jgi:type I restriction enzyme S subunit